MVSEITDKGESLEELLAQVPDRHHALSRKGGVLSVNGRHPAPLDQWQPEYCGDIDMAISSDGTWYHEGIIIKRPELWQLFAGILRLEEGEGYYLVTPVEKCRVKVALPHRLLPHCCCPASCCRRPAGHRCHPAGCRRPLPPLGSWGPALWGGGSDPRPGLTC